MTRRGENQRVVPALNNRMGVEMREELRFNSYIDRWGLVPAGIRS